MQPKVKIYIEKSSLEIIAQNSSNPKVYFRNVIEIFRKYADIYLDTTANDLNMMQNPKDLNDPGDIFTFIQGYGLSWPNAANDKFDALRNNTNQMDINGNVIYILNNITEIKKFKEKYGVWAILDKDVHDDIFGFSFGKSLNLEKVGKTNNGWINILSPITNDFPPSNSFVLSDGQLLFNNIIDKNKQKCYCGLENLKELLSIILPNTLDVPFYLLIMCNKIDDPQMVGIISKWVKDVQKLRKFEIVIEFFTTSKTLHSRDLYANNYRIEVDRGFYVFKLNKVNNSVTNIVNRDGASFNKIDIKTYLSAPFDKGDTILDIALTELDSIKGKYNKFLKNTGDPKIIVAIDPKYYSKNRILF